MPSGRALTARVSTQHAVGWRLAPADENVKSTIRAGKRIIDTGEQTMQRFLIAATAAGAWMCATGAQAQPEYVTIEMGIDVARPAAEVWDRVGGYCDIAEWLEVDCEITSGDGGMGTVRVLAGGRIVEILVAQTELAYGYTQPVREGQFYNLYHGFMEARPVTADTSEIRYTLVYDISDKADQAAKDADIERRRGMFEAALANMKRIAEAP
jgi:hypothetical protein